MLTTEQLRTMQAHELRAYRVQCALHCDQIADADAGLTAQMTAAENELRRVIEELNRRTQALETESLVVSGMFSTALGIQEQGKVA